MKKLIVLLVFVSVLGVGKHALADDQKLANAATAVPSSATLPSSVIDNIEVPYDVVMYVQMEYQGYAVTKVSEQRRGKDSFYLLQVSRDTQALPHESIFLLYTKDWKLSGQQAAPAAPTVRPKVAPQSAQSSQPVQQQPAPSTQSPNQVNDNDSNDGPREGGRGGDDAGQNRGGRDNQASDSDSEEN